jgi:hypothetical protein
VAIAFHPSEPRLASVGLDDEHTVAVWKDVGGAWFKVMRMMMMMMRRRRRGRRRRMMKKIRMMAVVATAVPPRREQFGRWFLFLLSMTQVTREATAKGDNNVVLFLIWARSSAPDGEDAYPLVSGGAKHIRFWKVWSFAAIII